MTPKLNLFRAGAFLGMISLSLAGCHLGQPSSASFASVKIASHSTEEIQNATVAVFREDGYRAAPGPGGTMVFEQEGSRMSDIAYGGVAPTYYGAQTKVRVRADIVDLGGGSQRLQCKAFMIRNAGDSFFEEEQPLANIRSRPYQDLLDKVAARLK